MLILEDSVQWQWQMHENHWKKMIDHLMQLHHRKEEHVFASPRLYQEIDKLFHRFSQMLCKISNERFKIIKVKVINYNCWIIFSVIKAQEFHHLWVAMMNQLYWFDRTFHLNDYNDVVLICYEMIIVIQSDNCFLLTHKQSFITIFNK